MRAWDVHWTALPRIVAHVEAETRDRAKAIVYRRAREAGYRALFTDMRAGACTGACAEMSGNSLERVAGRERS